MRNREVIADAGDWVASGIATISAIISVFSARYARTAVSESRLAATRTRQYELQSDIRSHVEAIREHLDRAQRWLASENPSADRAHEVRDRYSAIAGEAAILASRAPSVRDETLRQILEKLSGATEPSGDLSVVLTHSQYLAGDLGSTLDEREAAASGAPKALAAVRATVDEALSRLAVLDAEGGD